MSNSRSIPAPVKIGVVGLGTFGRLHLETIANLSEAQLVDVVDRDPQQLAQLANSFSDLARWNDIEAALANSDANAWVVASSTASHVAIAEQILKAGKSVLLEKPIASSVAEAERLAPLVSDASGNLMMGHLLLFNSEFIQLRQEIEQRGPFSYLDCVRHRPVTTLDHYPGESPFYLTMIHDLSMALVLKNRQQPQQITAQVHRTKRGQCDLGTAQLQWDDGALATFTASFMTPDGLGNEGYDRLEAFGTGWAARINANPRPLEIWDDRSRWPMTLEMSSASGFSQGMLAEELRCFCRVVNGQQSVPLGATYQDAIQIQGWLQQMEAAVS